MDGSLCILHGFIYFVGFILLSVHRMSLLFDCGMCDSGGRASCLHGELVQSPAPPPTPTPHCALSFFISVTVSITGKSLWIKALCPVNAGEDFRLPNTVACTAQQFQT